jgi:hypothetical protein
LAQTQEAKAVIGSPRKMTDLERRLEAARRAGDGAEIARLRFQSGTFLAGAHRRYNPEPIRFVEAGDSRALGAARSRSSHVRTASVYTPTRDPGELEDNRPLVILNRSIFDQLKDWGTDGKEDGAWLVGPTGQRSRVIEASRTMFPALESARELNAVAVPLVEGDLINDELYPRFGVVGHAHSQPSSSKPSNRDLEYWRRAVDHFHLNAFVGVIVKSRFAPREPVDVSAFVFSKERGQQTAQIHWRM